MVGLWSEYDAHVRKAAVCARPDGADPVLRTHKAFAGERGQDGERASILPSHRIVSRSAMSFGHDQAQMSISTRAALSVLLVESGTKSVGAPAIITGEGRSTIVVDCTRLAE